MELTFAEKEMAEKLSPAELALLERIADPKQRSMQMIQMCMQHQAMTTTMLTNIEQMRKDFLAERRDEPDTRSS